MALDELEEAVCLERAENEAEHSLPKYVQTIVREIKFTSPLLGKTQSGSRAHLGDSANLASSLVFLSCLQDVDEPEFFEEAQDYPNWMQAMQEEISSIEKSQIWDLVDLPIGKKAIGTRWVYKVERKVDGSIDRLKAHLVAKGYAQQKGIDFEETFAPTS